MATHYVTVKFPYVGFMSANHIPDYIEIFEEPRTNQNVRYSMRQSSSILQYYGIRACCIILSFMFWFLVVHGVRHLDFGGGNLCAVASFYDEYYSVIGPFWIF